VEITEVRVKLLEGRSDRLRAFCSITIDDEFVVHDLRVIDGRKGLFVAMPSRKLSDSCPRCGGKNHLRAKYCSDCGGQLDPERALKGVKVRDKYHVDVAHPIVPACREIVQKTVLDAYEAELGRVSDGLGPTGSHERDETYGEQIQEEIEPRIAAEAEERYEPKAEEPKEEDDPSIADEAEDRYEPKSEEPEEEDDPSIADEAEDRYEPEPDEDEKVLPQRPAPPAHEHDEEESAPPPPKARDEGGSTGFGKGIL